MVGGLDPFYFHVGNMVLNAAVTLLFQRTSHLFLKHAVVSAASRAAGAWASSARHIAYPPGRQHRQLRQHRQRCRSCQERGPQLKER